MSTKKIINYIAISFILVSLSFIMYLIGIHYIIGQSIKSDNRLAMKLVHIGLREIKQKENLATSVLYPEIASKELNELGYYIDFEKSEDSYILGVSLKRTDLINDYYYCINNNYEAGLFDNAICEL
ncbi:MAG: hypothetical protein ACSHW7_02165 [Patiriisocius sp.]|uniref:hypothetical protein n=1 Tax=Patiriisocius sp. TaxID=2822396 RepID=UPI003EF51225